MAVTLLSTILWALSLLVAGAACSLWGWALVGLLRRPRRAPGVLVSDPPRFLVVIPAHNEAHRLPALLTDLRGISYPADRYQVWVVADNCSDETADVATAHGARALVRTDPDRLGKGWALAFALEEAMQTQAEAVLVLDADSHVPAQLLSGLARRLRTTPAPRALQLSYRLQPGDTAESLLLAAENLLEDRLFYGSRASLGVPTLLRGNGMCLTLPLLRDHPWQAQSVAEDAEYGTELLVAGERPQFVPEVQVTTPAPTRRAQTVVQRTRWGVGHWGAVRAHGLRILLRGLRHLDWRLCDAALGLCLTSKSALVGLGGVALLLSWPLHRLVGPGPAAVSAVATLALLTYLLLGVFLCRPRPRLVLAALAAAPAALFVRLWIYTRGLSPRRLSWERTPD